MPAFTCCSTSQEVDVEKMRIVRLARKILPLSSGEHDGRFVVRENGTAEVHHAFPRPHRGGADRPRLRARLDPGHLRRHARSVHRLHVQRLRRARPALALFCAGRAGEESRLPAPRPGVHPDVYWREDARGTFRAGADGRVVADRGRDSWRCPIVASLCKSRATSR